METQIQTVATNQLINIVEASGLEKTKSDFILQKFQDYFKIAADWEKKAKAIVITDLSQTGEMKMAREGRLFLKAKRVEVEKTRKELKEQSLREGKAIDGIANVLKALIEPTEEYLEQQEKYAEIKEAEFKAARKDDRLKMLAPYEVNTDFFDLVNMPDENFANLLETSKMQWEKRQQEARKAEEERIAKLKAEAEEREKMRTENERLKKEAQEKEKALAEERARAEAERAAEAEKSRKEREAIEAKAKVEREAAELQARKEREENEKKLKAEREAKAKLEEELRQKQIAEAKAKAEQEAQIEAEAAKGDKEKFDDFMKDLEILTKKYQFKSKKYRASYAVGVELLNKTINHLISKQ